MPTSNFDKHIIIEECVVVRMRDNLREMINGAHLNVGFEPTDDIHLILIPGKKSLASDH